MHRSGRGLRRTLTLALVAVTGAAMAPAAQATTVSFGPGANTFRLTIADAQGVADNILVQRGETAIFVIDRAPLPTLTAATGCTKARLTIRCAEGFTSGTLVRLDVDAFLGGGNDRYESVAGNQQNVNGGPGADTILPLAGSGVVNGDDGADLIGAAPPGPFLFGNWQFNGGPGDDTIRVGLHRVRDVVSGGVGTDTASYLGRTDGVTVSLAVTDFDGSVGENDDIRSDVENLIGSDFNDTLSGTDGSNEIAGGLGSDVLRGLGGFDRIVAGDDGVPDTTIDCGPQPKPSLSLLTTPVQDRAIVDLTDPAPVGCEAVESAPRNEHPTVRIGRATRTGRVLRVTLECPKGARRTCRGTVGIVVAGRTAATTTHRLARGTTRTVRLRLPAALARRAATSAVAATIEAREKAGDGRAKRTRARVSL